MRVLFFALLVMLAGCKHNVSRIHVVSSEVSLVPAIEQYNKVSPVKAIFVYNEDVLSQKGDIVIGRWLRGKDVQSNFFAINFSDKATNSRSDKSQEKIYLIPISYDLPVLLFSQENHDFVYSQKKSGGNTITVDEARKIGLSFNKSSKGKISTIGFAPQSSDDFLYFLTKTREPQNWSANGLSYVDEAVEFIKGWAIQNGGVQEERNFVYKYLSQPNEKRVVSGRTLFAYTTISGESLVAGDNLFKKHNNGGIEYCYIVNDDGTYPVEDNLVMMGVLNSGNHAEAIKFVEWYCKQYSVAKSISGQYKVYSQKPYNWEKIKRAVIIPYVKDAIAGKKTPPIGNRYDEWYHAH